jgi:hypothetical protein
MVYPCAVSQALPCHLLLLLAQEARPALLLRLQMSCPACLLLPAAFDGACLQLHRCCCLEACLCVADGAVAR